MCSNHNNSKTTFVFDATWWQMMECLPDDEKLSMVGNIITFATTGARPELTGYPMIFFNMVCDSILRSQAHYEEKVKRRAGSGLRNARKVQNMRCKACAASGECSVSAAVCESGAVCDRLSISEAAEMVIGNCQECGRFGGCRHKFSRVTAKEYSPCASFVNGVNEVNDADANNMSNDNGNDDTDMSYSTPLHKNISSSSPSVQRSGKGGEDEKAPVYDKQEIVRQMVRLGADEDWAAEKFDELEAMGFRSGGKMILSLISYMRVCWQANCKKMEAAKKKTESQMRSGTADVSMSVPEEMRARFEKVRERTLTDSRDIEGFTRDFHIVNVIGSTVYVRVPSKTTLNLYSSKYGGDGFFERLRDEFAECVIKVVYES